MAAGYSPQSADQINKTQTNTAAHSLITKERTQKLDLLIHLLSNLPQALVVCGPEGIGKTTLLTVLQERKTDSWRYCFMQGNADLSFEALCQQLAQALTGRPGQSLFVALGQYESQHKQVILIIDNAGELVPGLIAAIIQYAAANPSLRAIFALTHDELQMKRGSDRAVDDCHIVEIPTLSEKQCGDFLQYLSTKPALNLSFKAISENMIAHIYRETHGVPGRIIAGLSGNLSSAKPGGKMKWIVVFVIAAAIAIALDVLWLKNNDKKPVAPVAVEQKADTIKIAPPQPESQIMLTLPPAQSAAPPQERSIFSFSGTEGPVHKEKEEPLAEVNSSEDKPQAVIPAVKPEVASTRELEVKVQPEPVTAELVQKPDNNPLTVAEHKIPEPVLSKQGKAKQPVSSKTMSVIKPIPPENLQIKPQSESMSTVGVVQKPDITPQKTAEQLWALQEKEKQKQAELNQMVDSVEPVTSNNLELIQIPPKPVDVAAVPEGQLRPEKSLVPLTSNFTLQLMVLSKQSSVDSLREKYPVMGSGLSVIKTFANGQEKFVLNYGSYPDITSANKAKQLLPFEFRNALVRRQGAR